MTELKLHLMHYCYSLIDDIGATYVYELKFRVETIKYRTVKHSLYQYWAHLPTFESVDTRPTTREHGERIEAQVIGYIITELGTELPFVAIMFGHSLTNFEVIKEKVEYTGLRKIQDSVIQLKKPKLHTVGSTKFLSMEFATI